MFCVGGACLNAVATVACDIVLWLVPPLPTPQPDGNGAHCYINYMLLPPHSLASSLLYLQAKREAEAAAAAAAAAAASATAALGEKQAAVEQQRWVAEGWRAGGTTSRFGSRLVT